MLAKVLISCALLVAAQAGYVPSHYGSNKALIGGYAAQFQPAVSLTVLPSYGNSYGVAPSYGPSYGYAGQQGYAHHQGPMTIPYYNSQPIRSHYAGVDGDALQLANLVWALPSAGSPNPAVINIPHSPSTGYSAPAVLHSKDHYDGHANGASAAAAATNVDSYKSKSSHSAY